MTLVAVAVGVVFGALAGLCVFAAGNEDYRQASGWQGAAQWLGTGAGAGLLCAVSAVLVVAARVRFGRRESLSRIGFVTLAGLGAAGPWIVLALSIGGSGYWPIPFGLAVLSFAIGEAVAVLMSRTAWWASAHAAGPASTDASSDDR